MSAVDLKSRLWYVRNLLIWHGIINPIACAFKLSVYTITIAIHVFTFVHTSHLLTP